MKRRNKSNVVFNIPIENLEIDDRKKLKNHDMLQDYIRYMNRKKG